MTADKFGLFVTAILVIVGLLSIAFAGPTIDRERLPGGEYHALMLFGLAGMMLMATATDLLVIFLALEVLSLAVYVLTGIRRDSPTSTEAALKYFLLGAFSSAFFLYGIALTYGLTGTTRLARVGALLCRPGVGPHAAAACSQLRFSSSASRSRWRPCRFTCGRLMPTKAHRRRSPASCPPA